ncbi:MAG: HlyD family efflux transporter periplasmic adaptor subunit [Bacteroidota bacterium]
MLNISDNRVDENIVKDKYSSFGEIMNPNLAHILTYWLIGFLVVFIAVLFAPWTQNINASGKLTTLRPNQRPQTIESTVAGRIEKWYVTEGDTVSKGDTILYISEIKDAYFDPALLDRTRAQIDAKSGSIESYGQKTRALGQQINALAATRDLKLQEGENKIRQTFFKVQADSIDLRAAEVNDSIALLQLKRWETLFAQDLKSRTDLEKMRKERQEATAKLISSQNKLAESRVALLNARISFNNIANEYQEKIAKASSDQQSAMSDRFEAEAQVQKMENQYSNYEYRANFRYIIAPQDGFINKALKSGIGETVKEGESVVSIVPLEVELAAEIFIRPVDVPLIKRGEPVQLEFDGWPAIVFGSGWPNASFGTFRGEVYAVENNISENGLYRVLIEEADSVHNGWPQPLRVGSGVNAFALLNDVPLWYEIWRQLNGFPPEYYEGVKKEGDKDGKVKNGKTKGTGF